MPESPSFLYTLSPPAREDVPLVLPGVGPLCPSALRPAGGHAHLQHCRHLPVASPLTGRTSPMSPLLGALQGRLVLPEAPTPTHRPMRRLLHLPSPRSLVTSSPSPVPSAAARLLFQHASHVLTLVASAWNALPPPTTALILFASLTFSVGPPLPTLCKTTAHPPTPRQLQDSLSTAVYNFLAFCNFSYLLCLPFIVFILSSSLLLLD